MEQGTAPSLGSLGLQEIRNLERVLEQEAGSAKRVDRNLRWVHRSPSGRASGGRLPVQDAQPRVLSNFFFLNIQAVLHSFRIAASPLPALPLPESPFGKASSHWTESSQKPTPVQPNFAEGFGPKFGAEESDRKGSEKEK